MTATTRAQVHSSEHEEQVVLFQWIHLLEERYPDLQVAFSIPNGAKLPYRKGANGRRWSPEAVRLKAEGLRPGIPDIFIAAPRPPYCGLFLELKVNKNKPSPEQREIMDKLQAHGYRVQVCYGANSACRAIRDYLGIEEVEYA